MSANLYKLPVNEKLQLPDHLIAAVEMEMELELEAAAARPLQRGLEEQFLFLINMLGGPLECVLGCLVEGRKGSIFGAIIRTRTRTRTRKL